jgi:RNA polymerase sigma factor (sigma-70 family)
MFQKNHISFLFLARRLWLAGTGEMICWFQISPSLMIGTIEAPLRGYSPAPRVNKNRDTDMAHRFLRSIDRWPAPPNWSPRDWSEELQAEVVAAAWEAEQDFDPARGVPLSAFVQQRVLTRSLKRYRREWAYARRCRSHVEGSARHDLAIDERFSSIDISESLRTVLRRLPAQQLRLIEGLFWEEKTEVEVASILCLTQSGISRRKRRALDQLRRWMDESNRDTTNSKMG